MCAKCFMFPIGQSFKLKTFFHYITVLKLIVFIGKYIKIEIAYKNLVFNLL